MTPYSQIPPNSTIIEAGSYDGKNAQRLADYGTVHSFEPNPASYEILKFLADDRVTFWNLALTSHHGKTPFLLSNSPAHDTIKKPRRHPHIKWKDDIIVQCTTLDNWNKIVRKDESIGLLWVDVCGSEGDLLLGGISTLNRTSLLYIRTYAKREYERAMDKARTVKALPGFEVLKEVGEFLLLKNRTYGL